MASPIVGQFVALYMLHLFMYSFVMIIFPQTGVLLKVLISPGKLYPMGTQQQRHYHVKNVASSVWCYDDNIIISSCICLGSCIEYLSNETSPW